ncbi:hypothetical protein LTR37_002036 [Vermiconidia calcicola]|uniref:Uncharacterized protein n=1 Tax=Vermiconidia calcicola TaxID=1690605 RepID=A0ACC3NTV4_9PEZI|nr:hypothetical protein LTR37_002036 [Vermiconidia calcicola]
MDLAEAFTGPPEAAFAFIVSMLVCVAFVPCYAQTWLNEIHEALSKSLSPPPGTLALIALFGLGLLVLVAQLVVYKISPFLYLIIPVPLFDREVSRVCEALFEMGWSSQPQIIRSEMTVRKRDRWSIGILFIALPGGWIVQWYDGRSLTFEGLLMGITCVWTVVLLALMAVWMTLWMCTKVMKWKIKGVCYPRGRGAVASGAAFKSYGE